MVDTDGRTYLDCVGGIGCAPLGHADPRWVEAISRQLGRVSAAANSYRTAPQQAFAAALLERMPIKNARVFFCSTGTESTEASIKLALKATGRDVIIAFDRAFHGRSLGALSLTANPAYRDPFVRTLDDEGEGFAALKVVRAPYGDLEAVRGLLESYRAAWPRSSWSLFRVKAGSIRRRRQPFSWVSVRSAMSTAHSWDRRDPVGVRPHRPLHRLGDPRGTGRGARHHLDGQGPRRRLPRGRRHRPGGRGRGHAARHARHDLRRQPGGLRRGACHPEIIEADGLYEKAAAQLPTLQALADARPLPVPFEIRGVGAMIGVGIGAPSEKLAAPLGARMPELGVLVTVCGGHTVRSLLPFFAGEEELGVFWSTLHRALEGAKV